MVGLKTFWILISSLFLFAACLPQTKQSQCGSNEAFNASLRTCVPVVGGPTSFINIATYTPSFTQTRYKNDTTLLTFEITVSNPYAQSYTIAWERVFNGAPVSMCSNATTCSFTASLLGTTYGEVGTHILTAKIKDANGSTVDTHSFELKINDFPKPTINTTTYDPAFYSVDKIPSDARVPFSFTIKNNDAVINSSQNFRTTWTIVKNGTVLLTEVDAFTDYTPTGTNFAYFGTYAPPASVPAFNPATLGVGSYIVRAVVQNDSPGEIVDEHQWNVIIKEPDLANVTTISLPAPGVTINAHHSIDYNDFPALSWVSGSPATQPNFCVDIDDRDGTYPGDSKSIQVRFYLDSLGGDICTKKTLDTPGTQTICLIDANNCMGTAAPFDTSLLKFVNPSPNIPLAHKVTARLFDEATSQEFQRSDIVPSSGSYPIEWNVMVNPINSAPIMSFGPAVLNPTGCISSGPYSKTGCIVSQGTPFTVSFTVSDDFYTASANPGEFAWEFKLKYNNADIATPPFVTGCSKGLGATTPAYATVWSCTMVVPHYIATGALHPNGPFQVVASLQDSGSPIGGAPLTAQSLTWTLNVTETNAIAPNIQISAQAFSSSTSNITRETPLPATVMDPAGTTYATEMETVVFRVGVRDPELDDFSYSIYKCGTGSNATTCTTPELISSPAINYLRAMFPPVVLPFTDTTNTDPVLVNALSYTLSETLLLDSGRDVNKTTGYPVYFKVEVADKPSTLPMAQVKTDSEIFTLYVRNYNPAPVIDVSSANPAPNTSGTSYPVVAGFPFSINPGVVTDASIAVNERTVIYQWYASGDSGTTWTAITGATSKNLSWTPTRNAPASIALKLCVGDRPAANPILDPASGGNCTAATWWITPKTYLATSPSVPSNVGSEVAVWRDTNDGDAALEVFYSAYVGVDNRIHVNKILRDAAINYNVVSVSTVSFDALSSGGTPTLITNLSLAGTQNSLYVAYAASTTSINLRPQLRRIDKTFTVTTEEKSAFPHKGKFGFHYTLHDPTANLITETCAGTACVITFESDPNLAAPVATQIAFTAAVAAGETITINGATFTADATAAAANQFCTTGGASGCLSAGDIARNFTAKINASSDPLLQGLTAVQGTGANEHIVSLMGMSSLDHLDIPRLVGKNQIGKLWVDNDKWYLPIINASEVGIKNNNITVLSGPIDQKLRDNDQIPSYDNTLDTIGAVNSFDAKINQNNELVIASISAADQQMTLSRFTLTVAGFVPFAAPAVTELSPFGSLRFEKVELAANTTGNNYVYVVAKELPGDGGKYHIGRYSSDFSGPLMEFVLTDRLSTTDSTSTYVTNSITDPTLVAYPNSMDARLFFKSSSTVRMARWKSDNTIGCGTCSAIGYTGTTSKIAISSVTNTTLGTSGDVANENQKDVVYVFSNYLSGADYFWQFGMINLKPELIHSSTPDTLSFLWGVPFAK